MIDPEDIPSWVSAWCAGDWREITQQQPEANRQHRESFNSLPQEIQRLALSVPYGSVLRLKPGQFPAPAQGSTAQWTTRYAVVFAYAEGEVLPPGGGMIVAESPVPGAAIGCVLPQQVDVIGHLHGYDPISARENLLGHAL